MTEEEFNRCFDVNVKGIFHATQSLIPIFKENPSKESSIVNIGSVGATRPRARLVWYNASKKAVCNVRMLQLPT